MLDLTYIRAHPDEVRGSITRRGLTVNLDKFLELDRERSRLIPEIDELRSKLKARGKPSPEERSDLREMKTHLAEQEKAFAALEEAWRELYLQIPNLVHPKTPTGEDDSSNREIRTDGKPPRFGFTPLDHLEIGRRLDLIDFERGAKVTGSRFYFLKNEAVELELALIRYGLDLLKREGFIPVDTPDLARNDMIVATGFAPRGDESNVYNIEDTDLSLIGTSEITLLGYHAEEVLEPESLPLKYAGVSRCFRREAGTYGQESRGLYRVHQFTKLEMFVYCLPQNSEKMHEHLLELEEQYFSGLEIPYRVVDVATGDLGLPYFRKYDLEAWMPGRGGYGEVTSTSNTTDFQSRRLGIRYRTESGETDFVHTLNGTAVAISRALIALLENYQRADGSISVPEALRPYLSFTEVRR